MRRRPARHEHFARTGAAARSLEALIAALIGGDKFSENAAKVRRAVADLVRLMGQDLYDQVDARLRHHARLGSANRAELDKMRNELALDVDTAWEVVVGLAEDLEKARTARNARMASWSEDKKATYWRLRRQLGSTDGASREARAPKE